MTTTNQTIDGVPRAALEILLSGKGGLAQAAAAHELRALLDAPACKTCNGTRIVSDGAMYCSSGGIPFECGPIECVKDCPDCHPAAQPQGEPVCYLVNDRFGGKAYLEEGSEALAIRRRLGFTDEIALYAEQPAPVAIEQKYDDTLLPFLAFMRRELHSNSRKGDREGWLGMTQATAMSEVHWHVKKLELALASCDLERITEHSADVANMCMMLLDVCGGIPPVDYGDAPDRVFGMSLVVDGNMPDDEMHLVSGDGGTIKLVVNELKPGEFKTASGVVHSMEVCLHCWGTGSISTGIMEASDAVCNHCDGTGTTGKARDV